MTTLPNPFESVGAASTTDGPAAAQTPPPVRAVAGSLLSDPQPPKGTTTAATLPIGAAAGLSNFGSLGDGGGGREPSNGTTTPVRGVTAGRDRQPFDVPTGFVLVERSLLESVFRQIQATAHRERLDALPAFLRAPRRDYLDALERGLE